MSTTPSPSRQDTANSKAGDSSVLISTAAFNKLNLQNRKNHLLRFSAPSEKIDTLTLLDLARVHKSRLDGMPWHLIFPVENTTAAITTSNPMLSSSLSTSATERTLYTDVLAKLTDASRVKEGFETEFATAIRECGVVTIADVPDLISGFMNEDVARILNCFNGVGKSKLSSILETLKLHLNIPAKQIPDTAAQLQTSIFQKLSFEEPLIGDSAKDKQIADLQAQLATLSGDQKKGKPAYDDDVESLSSNESIDSKSDESNDYKSTASRPLHHRKSLQQVSTKDSKRIHSDFIKNGKSTYPLELRNLSTSDIAKASLSTGLFGYGILGNVTMAKFSHTYGKPKKSESLQSTEVTGVTLSPRVSNLSGFLSGDSITNTPIVLPQTYLECQSMIVQLHMQCNHAETSLSFEESKEWQRELRTFQKKVTERVLTILPSPPDSPATKHILARFAVCKFFLLVVNRATVHNQPVLLNKDFAINWDIIVTSLINNTVPITSSNFNYILILSGYLCNHCHKLGQTEQLCWSCKTETSIYQSLFTAKPSSTAKSSIHVEKWRDSRKEARQAFKLLPGNVALTAGDFHKAFFAAHPQWLDTNMPPASSSADIKVSKFCDEATCIDFVMKNQAKFDLPSALHI